jgi:hypothetical protein
MGIAGRVPARAGHVRQKLTTGEAPHVRYGTKADIGSRPINVRFTPESGHRNSVVECPLCAKSRHSALQQKVSLFDHLVEPDIHKKIVELSDSRA